MVIASEDVTNTPSILTAAVVITLSGTARPLEHSFPHLRNPSLRVDGLLEPPP